MASRGVGIGMTTGGGGKGTGSGTGQKLRFRSPWLEQLDPSAPPNPLGRNLETGVAVVGAGIAGLATAYFILRDTRDSVVLVERSQAGHGASGRNAGQLATYFERPLCGLVDAYGFDKATRAQAEIDSAWELLDEIVAHAGIRAQIERFEGAMGMYSLNHLLVHLRNQHIRREAKLPIERVEISDRAPFIQQIPGIYDDFYEVVPQSAIQAWLKCTGEEYLAVLINRKGCANSAVLCQDLLAFLKRAYAGRFTFHDHTAVDKVTLHASDASVQCGHHAIAAARVVMCTNGFNHHRVENCAGEAVGDAAHSGIDPVIGYMTAFLGPSGAKPDATSYIRNTEIGGVLPYFYSTRRPYTLGDTSSTLVCLGGPETRLEGPGGYEPDSDMPSSVMQAFDEEVRPIVAPDRPAGSGYDFAWHGLMGYTKHKVRLVGFEPRNPVLMYNLGCNGVGFLPSIAGGARIARLHRGMELEPSIFDPA